MLRAAMGFLTAVDAADMAAETQAQCLQVLEQLNSMSTVRSLPGTGDDGPADGFEDRSVRLETTFEGAGVLSGELTPECGAVVTAVLDALSAPVGAEDTRTHAQRTRSLPPAAGCPGRATARSPARTHRSTAPNVRRTVLPTRITRSSTPIWATSTPLVSTR